jgi:hypothetical protein
MSRDRKREPRPSERRGAKRAGRPVESGAETRIRRQDALAASLGSGQQISKAASAPSVARSQGGQLKCMSL